MTLRLLRLTLTDFRNYRHLTWAPDARITALFGPNGSGKTNLLEAISLLSPGRGLRGARNADFARRGDEASSVWGVAARLKTDDGVVEIGTGAAPNMPPGGPADRRVFRLDGVAPRSQAEIASRLAMVWLTPQMDRLFQEGASGRRRFLDRLVWAVEPGHARQVASYDAAMSGRNRLLREGLRDAAWLAALEDGMARHGVAVTVARMALVQRLDAVPGVAGFPPAQVGLACPLAERLRREPAVKVEAWLRATLAGARPEDARAGAALVGAHRCDLALTDAHGQPAGLASTGEQKSMLVGLILSHAALVAQARGFAPILLLDEPAVHLDPERRAALFTALGQSASQVIVTGTDAETFLPLAGMAAGYRTGEGRLMPDRRFLGADRAGPTAL